ALEAEPEPEGDRDADRDQHDAVRAIADDAEVDLAGQRRRKRQRLVLGADQHGDRGDHDEDEPDREQDLIELRGLIEPGVEGTLARAIATNPSTSAGTNGMSPRRIASTTT